MTSNSAVSLLHRAILPEVPRRRHRPLRAAVLHRSLRSLDFGESHVPALLSALQLLSGQPARVLRARTGNARLGLREGARSGAKVTVRGPAFERFLLRMPAASRRPVLAALLRGSSATLPLTTLLPRTLHGHYGAWLVAMSPVGPRD